jgi:ABC-type Mn2+/Zn2+ transport system permease subunit
MDKNALQDVIVAGIVGGVTSSLVAIKRRRIKTIKDLILHASICVVAIYPAFILGEYLNLSSTERTAVGYIFGLLGDKIVEYIYNQQQTILDALKGIKTNQK